MNDFKDTLWRILATLIWFAGSAAFLNYLNHPQRALAFGAVIFALLVAKLYQSFP